MFILILNRTTQAFVLSVFFFVGTSTVFAQPNEPESHPELIKLFKDWRSFESPPITQGVPDYSSVAFAQRREGFEKLRSRLLGLTKENWPVAQKVDWHLLWAEMNGYMFNTTILKPWQRDPAFYKVLWTYQSDVPAHEGPTPHFIIEQWQYSFPLNKSARDKFLSSLKKIPVFYKQAKQNLTGNAKDLWITGIRDIQSQSKALSKLLLEPGVSKDAALVSHLKKAKESTDDLVRWLQNEAPKKTGPSGIGKENYSWYQQNVHLVPLSWEDEVQLLKRELARAWSSLKLEEHRNRNLPKLKDADSAEAYEKLAQDSAVELLQFLEENDIVTVKKYFQAALTPHLGKYIPIEKRNFFWITAHLNPKPLFSHFYHWFELARMKLEPHKNPLRKETLLYNIFDSRNEGLATAVEEMFMQAGLYDQNPRVREIVYILIAQRAARGLGSLYAHANMMGMEKAGEIHSEYTPRGWMKTEKELLIFEQHLYLRQPGYGTSYITGKYLIEEMMMDVAKLHKEEFTLKNFYDTLNEMGNIPVSLGRWEATHDASQIHQIRRSYQSLEGWNSK